MVDAIASTYNRRMTEGRDSYRARRLPTSRHWLAARTRKQVILARSGAVRALGNGWWKHPTKGSVVRARRDAVMARLHWVRRPGPSRGSALGLWRTECNGPL